MKLRPGQRALRGRLHGRSRCSNVGNHTHYVDFEGGRCSVLTDGVHLNFLMHCFDKEVGNHFHNFNCQGGASDMGRLTDGGLRSRPSVYRYNS